MTPRVLHVFPESVLEAGQEHLGSTKDVRGRTQYFRERGLEVRELAHHRSARGMLDAVRRHDLRRYDVVVVEFPLSVRATSELRRAAPKATLLTRSENAELLHRVDWMRAMGPTLATVKLAVRTLQTSAAELWAARRSDHLLSISAWEVEHYWSRLAPRDRVRWLPYYVPDVYLAELSPTTAARERVCVCLTSTRRNPVIEDSVRGFRRALATVPPGSGWRFVVTGDVTLQPDDRFEAAGMLASPGDVLTTSTAVALLSDYGYGFKTKLLEAVVAGNRVFVTPGLRRRLPPEMDSWTVPVDLRRPGSFIEALAAADQPLPAGRPNDLLRARHHRLLDALLGLQGATEVSGS